MPPSTPNLLVIARLQRDQDFRDRVDAAARFKSQWADDNLVWHIITTEGIWNNVSATSNGGVDASKVTDQQIIDALNTYQPE